jgi:hypothetical protein
MEWGVKLHRRTKEAAPRLPFSAARINGLPSTFEDVIEQSLRRRDDRGVSLRDVWGSSFFTAYIIGFPSCLESFDETRMLQVRKAILQSCFEENWEEILYRFKKTMRMVKARSDGAFEALRLGDIDGKQYFRTLEYGDMIGDDLFTNLRMSVRRLEDFVPL